MRRPGSPHEQQGFTLVELMAAALVLIVGMLSVLGVLRTGLQKTNLNNERVAATNLARELTETARQVAYTSLTPSALVNALRNGASDLGAGTSPWTVVRRNTTYTITANVCAYDDPADKIAASPPENKCADNPGGTAGDANGDDFRRVSFTLTWKTHGKSHAFKQSALIVNPSGGLGPRITSFTGPATTITSGTSAHFDIVTTWAATVHWNADDGTSSGNADMVSGNTTWAIDWDLKAVGAAGAILDGSYSLIAQAYDDRDIAGDAKVATVTINRSLPFAPTGFAGGHDTRDGDWVDFDWSLNSERDIVGYRLSWAGPDKAVGGGDDQLVCPPAAAAPSYLANTVTSCQDTSPPPGAATYYVQALDNATPATGSPRPGASRTLSVPAPGPRPGKPENASISGFDTPTLTWSAPSTGSVAFYRVYRDGTGPAARLARTTTPSYTDPGGSGPHDYWVSSVDAAYNESDLVPLTWNP